MGENQYYPGFAAGSPTNGWEWDVPSAQGVGQVSGLADDRVFAELFRVNSYDGTNVSKMVVPYGTLRLNAPFGASAASVGTVTPSGNADGSIFVWPFRAVIGSRTAAATDPLAYWRDIRSGIFTGTSGLGHQSFQLAANASGNPRWDLVYASVSVDNPGAAVSRRVKDPNTGVVTVQTKPVGLVQSVAITILAGTPGATPVVPTIPADSGGVYNIPLAVVRVRNGFNATTTLVNGDIRDYANFGVSDIADIFHQATAGISLHPADGNNDGFGSYASNFGWNAAGSGRPGCFMPPQWVGATFRTVEIDLANVAFASHANNGVVDSSMDWRQRFFVTWALASQSQRFANDSAASGVGPGLPCVKASGVMGPNGIDTDTGHSMYADGSIHASTGASVYSGTPASLGINAGSTVGLYVETTDGTLRVHYSGTPNSRIYLLVMATGQFPTL